MSATYPNTKLAGLEYRVFRRFQSLLSQESESKVPRYLVACSGGADSVALAACLAQVASRFKVQLVLTHVHHGVSENPLLNRMRDQAARRVRGLAKELGLSSVVVRRRSGLVELKSEEELRDFRLGALRFIAKRKGCGRIVFAHHS